VAHEPPLDFSDVYDAYSGRVRSYAAKLIGADEADDVANEVFVKIARSLNTVSDRSRLASWIYAVTLNTVRDAARARAARLNRLAPVAPPLPGEETGDSRLSRVADPRARTPEESAVQSEMVACYLDYVNKLPRTYYDVYVLSEFEGLSNDDLASRLSVSLGTAKIRLHRARARLHDQLRRHCRCYHNERGELMAEPKPIESDTE
jgi:RNA polymerase sigma-70 factor, ECF subfamily